MYDYKVLKVIDEAELITKLDRVMWGVKPSRIKEYVPSSSYRCHLKNEKYPLAKCQKVWVHNVYFNQRYAILTTIEADARLRQAVLDQTQLDILTYKGAMKVRGMDNKILTIMPILAEFNSAENKIVIIDGTHRFLLSRKLNIQPNILCFFGLELYRSVPVDPLKVIVYATYKDFQLALFYFGDGVERTKINMDDFLNLNIFNNGNSVHVDSSLIK